MEMSLLVSSIYVLIPVHLFLGRIMMKREISVCNMVRLDST